MLLKLLVFTKEYQPIAGRKEKCPLQMLTTTKTCFQRESDPWAETRRLTLKSHLTSEV
jgi:hypothetical protein